MSVFKPQDEAEIIEIVRWANESLSPVEIIGHGTKRSVGRLMEGGHEVDLSLHTGVTLYEPDELVLSAKAGTSLAEIEILLRQNGQCFQFEPMDYGPLLGLNAGKGTIGGMLGANSSGPRRLKCGAARDHILGVRAVSGRAELFKSGGRVVKNVSGYDVSKLMANSWGTLAVFSELTFKVMPAPETSATVVIRGLNDEAAARAMAMAMGSREEVSSAAHLPASNVWMFLKGDLGADPATILRIEGIEESVKHRSQQLCKLLGGESYILNEETSRQLWREVRDVLPFCKAGDQRAVWRVTMAPMQSWQMVDEFRRYAGVDAYYDWQGGLIWLRMEAEPEARILRKLIERHGGGHALLVRASEKIRKTEDIFQPQAPALAALTERLKLQFDPLQILNRGRIYPAQTMQGAEHANAF